MKNKIIILMTIFSIMFITVAWASFSTTLMITGEGTILTDSTPPTCGAWKLRPSTLTYAEATTQDAFIDPGTNNTWTDDSLILSLDCTDNTGCQADHYDVKTYDLTTKTDTNVLTQVIKDLYNNETTCTLPLGASNPYVDKDAPEVHLLNLFPEDGEFKVTVGIRDVKLFSSFQNTDGAYYTYEGKSFIGTGVNNLIISENIASQAKYASAYGTDNGDGTYTFADHPAADAAASYCTGCRLMTKDEAIAWDSTAGITESTKRIGKYDGSASTWWLADAYSPNRAWLVNRNGFIVNLDVTNSLGVRPAVSIDSNMKMSGSGTQGDPYVIMPANSNYAESGIVSAQFYYKKCGDNNWTALTKNSFAAIDTKVYNNWYIPSNSSTSTSCLSSAWGTYYFRVDVEDAVGNIKSYYSKKNTNSTYPVDGYTENENEMNQFALAPLKARNITYDNTGQPTLCTNVECAHDQLRYMFGLGLTYGITLDNRSATASGTETIYENYGDGFYLTNTSGTLSNKMTTSTNAITVPTKSNNSFLGYYTETNGGGTQYIDANGNITANATASLKRSAKLYAKWRRTVFYIILDMASGTGGTEMIYVNYNDGFYLNNTDGVLSNKMTTSTNALTIPTRVGYTFGGYYTGQNGAGTQIIDSTGKITSSASSTQFNTDEVLYAKWEQAPGLFDASGNVVKTWSELEALGLTKSAIETDYASSSAASADGTPYQILRSLSSNYNNKLVLPSTITKIGNYALHSNVTLSSITLPNTVTSIGDYSFDSSCISSINIPSSVSSIGEYAFSYSDITDINIPGNGSTTIADNAFLGCPILKTVTIGSGVTDVGRWVFRACDKLTTVTIEGNSNPNTPTNLGACAVSRNPALTAINFGTGAITIGQQAFVYNTSLKSIVIGRGVTSFSNTVFDNTDLTSISVDPNNPIFDSRNNCNAIIETSTNTLIYGFTTTTIPSTVTTIGKSSFAGINITSITIPNGVTTIDDSAFVRSGLTSITIPASVTFIGRSAFSKTSLTSVTFVTTSTWKAVPTRSSTSGTTLNVTDPANNATLLKSTYASRYIKRF